MAFGRRVPQAPTPESREPAPVAEIAQASEWEYVESCDEMTGRKATHAVLHNANQIVLPFPYQKSIRLRLNLIRSLDLSAGLILLDGQYAPSLNTIAFSSKVDDGRVINWTAKRTNVQGFSLIEMPIQFINELRPGTRLMIQLELYQAGHRVFQFNCSGLDPNFR